MHRWLRMARSAPRLDILPYARPLGVEKNLPGRIDTMGPRSDHEVYLTGWMLDPVAELTSIQVYVNGLHAATAQAVTRPDLASNFRHVPHAGRAGFECSLSRSLFSKAGYNHVDAIGCRADTTKIEAQTGSLPYGAPVGRYHTLYRPDIDAIAPSPPEHLMLRVVGHDDPTAFKTGGMKLYSDFLAALARRRNPAEVRRVLDWGCGCGRAVVHFMQHPARPEVHGCDIDGDAIAWCQANLRGGHFAQIDPRPPLPYPDGHFDAIVSCSVFSHLKRDMQQLWLAELRRVLAPGGLLLASFHGMFAARIAYPPEKVEVIGRAGIVDDTPDDALGDVIEPGYYTSTFQTREYTTRVWSKHMELVEYIEAGMHNYQDIAVMRRSA